MQENKILFVTPAVAKEWLSNNSENRNIREKVVDRYASMMIRGEWKLTHQGIAIDRHGNLLDGQHRLLAIIQSGKTVQMCVSFNVDPLCFRYIDGGVPRTLADRTKEPRSYIEVVNVLNLIINGKASPESVDQMIAKIELLRPYLGLLAQSDKKSNAPIVTSAGSRAAAIGSMLIQQDAAYVCMMYRDLVKGKAENLPPIGLLLVKAIMTNQFFCAASSGRHGSAAQRYTFFKMLPVFTKKHKDAKRWPAFSDSQQIEFAACLETILSTTSEIKEKQQPKPINASRQEPHSERAAT